jgi:outer membrane cobalamin receptor
MSDPIEEAFKALHQGNLLAAKDARIRQLEAEVERLREAAVRMYGLYDEAEAQVERLTKAGDAMAEDLPQFGSVKDWNAAKEGKQSNG